MSLIDELREYLRGVERGVTAGAAPTVGIDMPSARRYFVDALERREQGHGIHSVEASFWDRERRDGFLRDLEAELRVGLCADGDAASFRLHTEGAIDLLLRLPGRTLSRTRARELGLIVAKLARVTRAGDRQFDVARYALELRLVRSRGAKAEVSSIGQVLTRMPEPDAVHWLLTVETLQSLGPSDVYRMPIQAIIALDRHPEGTFPSPIVSLDDDHHHADTGERWLLDHGIVERLESIGLLDLWSKPDERRSGYTVRPAFLPLIAEIASQKPTPFSVLAETLIAEERGAVLPRTAAGAEGITDTATLALERHSRMVAHELHNSIVPVQHALQKLSDVLAQSAP
ncbi:MAG: hypothetical protein Q8M76_18505, partial [Spirochaetaceae bacterium]|nr:hypothetical protein [Spirochaetaceae bacterium]